MNGCEYYHVRSSYDFTIFYHTIYLANHIETCNKTKCKHYNQQNINHEAIPVKHLPLACITPNTYIVDVHSHITKSNVKIS